MAFTFNKVTDNAIKQTQDAFNDPQHKLLRKERLLLLMSDGRWHGGLELATKVSWRFSEYLRALTKMGVKWEKKRDPVSPKGENWYLYRLWSERNEDEE